MFLVEFIKANRNDIKLGGYFWVNSTQIEQECTWGPLLTHDNPPSFQMHLKWTTDCPRKDPSTYSYYYVKGDAICLSPDVNRGHVKVIFPRLPSVWQPNWAPFFENKEHAVWSGLVLLSRYLTNLTFRNNKYSFFITLSGEHSWTASLTMNKVAVVKLTTLSVYSREKKVSCTDLSTFLLTLEKYLHYYRKKRWSLVRVVVVCFFCHTTTNYIYSSRSKYVFFSEKRASLIESRQTCISNCDGYNGISVCKTGQMYIQIYLCDHRRAALYTNKNPPN